MHSYECFNARIVRTPHICSDLYFIRIFVNDHLVYYNFLKVIETLLLFQTKNFSIVVKSATLNAYMKNILKIYAFVSLQSAVKFSINHK